MAAILTQRAFASIESCRLPAAKTLKRRSPFSVHSLWAICSGGGMMSDRVGSHTQVIMPSAF
jgi:hypothetical protein